MRIISGSARGRKLQAPIGDKIRPTSDKVKESIFNIIQFDIEGRRVLDLFAGTGQLGIEALSRGAASAVFVDSSNDAVKLVRDNLKTCGLSDLAMVYASDGLRYLQYYNEQFDLIFIDPPYDTTLASKAVSSIMEVDKLAKNGIIIYETKLQATMPVTTPPYELRKTYKYGGVALAKIVRN